MASLSASDVARSALAGETARMRQLSLVMNCMIMSLIWASMSTGWSPTGTLVIPGKSTRVRLSTAFQIINRDSDNIIVVMERDIILPMEIIVHPC